MTPDSIAAPPVMVTPFRGKSMLPSLRPGDRIVWRRLDGTTFPPVGAVVGYENGDRFIAHRVIRVERPRALVWTRPDAAFRTDPPVRLCEVHWMAIEVQRDDRSFPPAPPREWERLLGCIVRVPTRFVRGLAGRAVRRARRSW